MKRFGMTAACAAIVGISAWFAQAAAPTVDGMDIAAKYGAPALLAVQANRTGFGKSELRFEGTGSEMNQMWVGQDGTNLRIGITGNLQTNGNAFIVLIDVDSIATGQNPLQTELCGGPPFALQGLGAQLDINTNGTPGVPADDFNERTGMTGVTLDAGFAPDYGITIDLFEANEYVSLYKLLNTPNADVSPFDDPGTGGDDMLDVFTTRCYVGTNNVNTGPPALTGGGDGFPSIAGGYAINECDQYTIGAWEAKFDDTNTDGVTDTDASGATAAVKGLEISLPLSDLGLTSTSIIRVGALVSAGGGGFVSNQFLPSLPATTGNFGGPYPHLDLTGSPAYDGDQFATIDLSTAPLAGITVDGLLTEAGYNVTTLVGVQQAPTQYGDQTTSGGLEFVPKSELDALYATNDAGNLYLGITGTLELNGNAVAVFLDTVAGGEKILTTTGLGGVGEALNGNSLPLLPDDSDVLYDYAVVFNAGGGTIFADLYDLQADTSAFIGSGPTNALAAPLAGGTNPNGMRIAYHFVDGDPALGVPGCGDFEACFFETVASIEASALTQIDGFDLAIPFADIGIAPFVTPFDINVWTIVSSGGGFSSDQALPSVRTDTPATSEMKFNVGNPPVNYTRPTFPDPNANFDARAATYEMQVVAAVSIDEARSVLVHGATPRSLVIADTGIEPRIPGANSIDFDLDGSVASVSAAVSCINPWLGSANVTVNSPTNITVDLTLPLPNQDCCEITLSGDAQDSIRIRTLAGDVDVNGNVNTADITAIKPNLGTAVTNANFLFDIDANGAINTADITTVKPRLGNAAATCP
jgi:hypothetical protein